MSDFNKKDKLNEIKSIDDEKSAEVNHEVEPDKKSEEKLNETNEPITNASIEKGIKDTEPEMTLDDTQRIKVLSPSMLIFKRFIRSKLAVAGSFILLFMFLFSFIGAFISPYGMKEVFYRDKSVNSEYAIATHRKEKVNYFLNGYSASDISNYVKNMVNSNIDQMEKEGVLEKEVNDLSDKTKVYTLKKLGENVYTLTKKGENRAVLVSSNFAFDLFDTKEVVDAEFKGKAIYSLYINGKFNHKSNDYEITKSDGIFVINKVSGAELVPYAVATTFIVRRANGEDSISIGVKAKMQETVVSMLNSNLLTQNQEINIPVLDKDSKPVFDKDGKPVFENTKFIVERKDNNFIFKNDQTHLLIDIYNSPSKSHWLGTDDQGMDVLTRIVYGGQISLLVGFVVIFIELLIGVILGGIAGFFGKWIDNLIMRLVDIFNCIPTLPIMIIMGSVFDKLQMDPYKRIMWLMVMLGVLGWSGIARLVRGQILSLREQEFMIAAEATGISSRRRIFKHLVPNVMPQLIVNATMGLGGIIITESTLSYLGLGAKFPLSTWGYIINTVSTAAAMVNYTYIWIPVGLLICLTVIAFNFVGDGLRDAFDPKMKR
ncbi:MAG: ABC transporter permease [Clostridia bacterium]